MGLSQHSKRNHLAKRIFEIDAQGQKCQSGYLAKKLPLCHFGTFVPVHRFQKFFWSNDLWLSIMKDLLHFFAKKVSLALSRAVYVLILKNRLNYFKFPSYNFKKSFLFWGNWYDFRRLGFRLGAFFWYLAF